MPVESSSRAGSECGRSRGKLLDSTLGRYGSCWVVAYVGAGFVGLSSQRRAAPVG